MRTASLIKWIVSVYVAMIVCIAVGLFSCNTVHKLTTSTALKTDSVSVKKIETIVLAKSDSTSTKQQAGSYEKETIYQYDTVYQVIKGDTVLKFVPRIIRVNEKGNYAKEEMATHSNYVSAASREIDSAMKHNEVKSVTKKKVSQRFPIIIVLGLIAAFAVGLIFIYFKKK